MNIQDLYQQHIRIILEQLPWELDSYYFVSFGYLIRMLESQQQKRKQINTNGFKRVIFSSERFFIKLFCCRIIYNKKCIIINIITTRYDGFLILSLTLVILRFIKA